MSYLSYFKICQPCSTQEILSLAKHGCQIIQLDEPVLMRYPDQAVGHGVADVARCFESKVAFDITIYRRPDF